MWNQIDSPSLCGLPMQKKSLVSQIALLISVGSLFGCFLSIPGPFGLGTSIKSQNLEKTEEF